MFFRDEHITQIIKTNPYGQTKDFINQINTYGRLYEGAGNRLLVVELPGYNRKDADLRMALAKTGLEKMLTAFWC